MIQEIPKPVTLGEAKAAISLARKLMEEEMKRCLHENQKLRAIRMDESASKFLQKAMNRKHELKTLIRLLEEIESRRGNWTKPAILHSTTP